MVLTVAYNKATSKFYSFYGRFMMSAARLTAGMLTQLYQWHLHLEGKDRNIVEGPHTQRRDLVFKAAYRLDSCSPSLCLFCFPPFGFVFEEKVDPTPWPLFLLGLRACQTYVIQEIPLLGPSGVTIATGTRTCRCRPSLTRSCAHAHWLALPCSLFPFIVRRPLL